jgi:hypothetical protein
MKKLFSILVALIVLCLSATPAFAADGKVTYNGEAQQFIFEPGSEHSPTDLFPNFKDVMPGDSITQKITVKNDIHNDVKVKIYIRSLGAHEDSVDFLSQLHLTVKKSEENEMAYMFDAAADDTAGLTDWVLLGTLYSGGEVNLDVVLDVPTSLTNEHSEQIGFIDWEFAIEEFPVEPGDPSPPTGDRSYIFVYIASIAGIVALAAVIIIFVVLKKDRKEKEN